MSNRNENILKKITISFIIEWKKKTTKSEFTSVSYASINSKLQHSAAKLSLIYLKSPCRWAEKLASCCANKEGAYSQTSTYFIFPWGMLADEQIVHFSKTGLRLTSNSWHCSGEASLKIIHTDRNGYSNGTSPAGIYTSRLSRRTSSLNET